MNHPVILDFDQSVGEISDATRVDLTEWQESIRFGCSMRMLRRLHCKLEQQLPKDHGTVLMGSGDYHHISMLLIERLKKYYSKKNPIEVVIFDNHPDNMRYLFGVHCGSWVSYVASLPFVSHVHVLGITSSDISFGRLWENRLMPLIKNKLTYWCMDIDVTWAKRLGLGKAFHCFQEPDELTVSFLAHQYRNTSPIYLSIDKDVLSPSVIQTNWDQGRFDTYHIIDTISALSDRIIGSDITGDVSNWQYTRPLKRLLSLLDRQPIIPLETLKSWQIKQHELNNQLLVALEKCQFRLA